MPNSVFLVVGKRVSVNLVNMFTKLYKTQSTMMFFLVMHDKQRYSK